LATFVSMITKIDHIGVAVANLEESISLFEKLFGKQVAHRETVATEKVHTAFFEVGESHLELLQPSQDDSSMQKFIDKRGPGIHQLALTTTDIAADMKRLREAGFELLSDEPKKGANGTLVCFIHPRSANGILIELVQHSQ